MTAPKYLAALATAALSMSHPSSILLIHVPWDVPSNSSDNIVGEKNRAGRDGLLMWERK
tara:strand:+ start:231 stop:407 length:177 start_codon:yes stop_codon:yes gene_type:complete